MTLISHWYSEAEDGFRKGTDIYVAGCVAAIIVCCVALLCVR